MKVKLFFVIAIAVLTIGCASAGGNLVVADEAVLNALGSAQDSIRDFCDANETFAVPCQDVRRMILPALEAGEAFNHAVAAQRATAIAPLIEAIGNLVEVVRALPESASGQIVRELAAAIAQAYATLGPAPERE